MPDDADPPRKLYGFKPTEFERVNQARPDPASATPAVPDPSLAATGGTEHPIDVRELHRAASIPGPVLAPGGKTVPLNEVHDILRDNLERAKAAGLMEVPDPPARKSRRKRDYLVLMIGCNGALAMLATYGLRTGNAFLFVYCLAGIGLISAGLTWVMWFVMDKY